jgi:hypothetical protein
MHDRTLRERIRAKVKEQRAVVALLLKTREQLRGSLFVRYGECGKEGCVCRLGRRHGPYYVLSARSEAGSGFSYLEGGRLREAKALVSSYRAFRSGLRKLKKVNGELVALLARYQRAMVTKGSRRLGIGAQA